MYSKLLYFRYLLVPLHSITRAVPQVGSVVETAVSVDAARYRELIWSYLVQENG